jgi:hypothetical protein
MLLGEVGEMVQCADEEEPILAGGTLKRAHLSRVKLAVDGGYRHMHNSFRE